MSKFELSLSENYVEDWTIVEAIREFFQNAIDQQALTKNNDMFFKYNEESETLYIGNKSSVLEAKSLLLGSSTKSHDDKTIGKHGEGYKVATLVAIRCGKTVIFYNYGKKEIWRPRMVKSRRYGTNILTFFTGKYIWHDTPENNLVIEIQGITEEEYMKIVESNLHLQDVGEYKDTTYGRILMNEKYYGKIYVNGLFVKKVQDMKYGYDILPKYLKLDRDRKMVDTFDIQFYTSSMWSEVSSSSSKDVIQLAKNSNSDIRFAHNLEVSLEDANKEYDEFIKEHGIKAIPVSDNDELKVAQAVYLDATPVFVNNTYKNILKKSDKFNIEAEERTAETTEDKLMIWIAPIKSRLRDDEYNEFLKIIDREEPNNNNMPF